MKPSNSLFALIVLFCAVTMAQAQISVGGGLGFGLDVEELAIQGRGVYEINDKFRGEGDFNYYLDGTDGVSYWELNLNANYMIATEGALEFYALAGLNFFHFSTDLGIFGETSDTDTGLNILGQVPKWDLQTTLNFTEKQSLLSEVRNNCSSAWAHSLVFDWLAPPLILFLTSQILQQHLFTFTGAVFFF